MKYIIITSISFLILINLSCKDKGVDPQDNYPPGYQHDIPWPSLADSPWPINHGDPQSTGRSKFIGPRLGILDKIVATPELQTGIVIGPDSTIYFTSSDFNSAVAGLYAYYPDGRLKWKFNTMHCWATPIVVKDGTIYFRDAFKVYAVNPDGALKWVYDIGGTGGAAVRSLTIGKDGTIYFLNFNFNLNALNPDGTKKWSLNDTRFPANFLNDLVFSPDGKTIYTAGYSDAVVAVDVIEKKIKWTFGKTVATFAPIVDCNGNLYFNAKTDNGEIYFYSLREDGTVRWEFLTNSLIDYGATIDKNGNIYFAKDNLFSLDYNGSLRWKLPLGDEIDCSLICDAEGTIYAGLW
ncbi:MAG: PQQ-binding-like beta-propeller repeat protein, partial [Bacteroidetes bacterium]|nr:PQQ-binding-like beta-propeller repeat protein [Bacteroidota bacterium]